MEADFSGWATKSGLKCSDGRTIMPGAFEHQDKIQVPLVWQHGHTSPENVLGHAILESRPEGVYAYGFFNKTQAAEHAKEMLEHKDINQLSIWANQLVERGKKVFHGAIREVSLVLSGANPGAVIENVSLRHSSGDIDELDDEAIIYTGLTFEHSGLKTDDEEDNKGKKKADSLSHNDLDENEETVQEVYDTLNEKQKELLHTLVSDAALNGLEHADPPGEDPTIAEVYDSMTDLQQQVLHYMIGQALESQAGMKQSDEEGIDAMAHHNVFEKKDDKDVTQVISHDDMKAIAADATKNGGSLKEAFESYALSHGIEDIDVLFPEAQNVDGVPQFLKRRTEWVSVVLDGVRKSPFSRLKTIYGDLTFPEARAKGYVKGNLKKEEFFKVARRVTTPTTVYKKQKLDRDDMIDITDFDVVMWLKGEMRIMLDEEVARAILVGDGRLPEDEDKINEEMVRPIATDDELYTTTVNINIDDSQSTIQEFIDAVVLNRSALRGTGLPTLFTTETYIARMMLLKDSTGRDLYRSLDEIAAKLRVSSIVAVEVLEEYPDIVAILVNLSDYTLGADKGGQVALFDDFDIDYNQYKYLIETRASGALTKLKSAMVVMKVAGNVTLVTPNAPTFDPETNVITIVATTGVTYKDVEDNVLSTGALPAIDEGESFTVYAYPSSGSYAFNTSDDDIWTFTGQ